MKLLRQVVTVLVAVVVLLSGSFGQHFTKTYAVDYSGSKASFTGARDRYRAGERVRLKTPMMTDSTVTFTVDGQPVPLKCDEGCFVIEFTMPEHDIVVDYSVVNDMIYRGE